MIDKRKYLMRVLALLGMIVGLGAGSARAEFIISSAILEFNSPDQTQQDIELTSRSKTDDYIIAEVSEILHPGEKDETRRHSENPAENGILVTPEKTVLTAGSHKVLRFVLLKTPDAKEHIYRVAIKPVIRGIESNSKVGLKVLIGYEVLVIVRPTNITSSYQAQRSGKTLTITNTGNSNVVFQNGQQCETGKECKAPVMRVYAGQTQHINLPKDAPVSYSVWDGKETVQKKF